jgi:hypothetical protein
LNIGQIWEVAGPLITTAIVILIVGLILQAIQRKIKSGITNKIIRVIAILTIGGPLLFLVYTMIRGLIFLYLYYN